MAGLAAAPICQRQAHSDVIGAMTSSDRTVGLVRAGTQHTRLPPVHGSLPEFIFILPHENSPVTRAALDCTSSAGRVIRSQTRGRQLAFGLWSPLWASETPHGDGSRYDEIATAKVFLSQDSIIHGNRAVPGGLDLLAMVL